MSPARQVSAPVAAVALGVALLAARGAADAAPRPGALPADATSRFTVRIENVSTPATLTLSTGATAPAPTSPGVWAVHTGANPLFVLGKPDRGVGLERQAEEGNPAALAAAVRTMPGVASVGTFTMPSGESAAGPLLPGKAYEFSFDARPGDRLSLAFMFAQSNDLFYAPGGQGIELFAGDRPVGGDVTSSLLLWDAGTEVNEEPGLGPNQAPRQKAPNSGAAERQPVARVHDRFTYPATGDVIRVSISASTAASTM
jgi:hypothetical protein